MTGRKMYDLHRASWLAMTGERLPLWEYLDIEYRAQFEDYAFEQHQRDTDDTFMDFDSKGTLTL